MDFRLANGKVIVLDKDAVFKDPRAESLAFLEALAERGNGDGEGKIMVGKELTDYTPDELYDELDRCSVEKARLPRRRDEGTDHTRRCWNERRKQIAAELKRRKLRIRRPGSRKALPTAAHLAARGRELREAAA